MPVTHEQLTAHLAAMDGKFNLWPNIGGPQCMVIFASVNKLLGGPAYSAPGAKDLWDNKALAAGYTQLPPTSVPRFGDIPVWGDTWGDGWGHVAIAILDAGDDVSAFGQNPTAASTTLLSKDGLLGYLRPKNLTTTPPEGESKMPLVGPDISRYQAGISFKNVPADIVIVGTSDGNVINPAADQQVQDALANGKQVGVYHYFRNDPITEARFWADITKGYQTGKIVFFLDAETAHDFLPSLCIQFKDEFYRLTGIKIVIYTYWHLLQAYNWQECVNQDIGLWGAWYPLGENRIDGYNPPARQSPPYWGETMMGWQYTSAGFLPGWGDRLDLNEFYVDVAGWHRYAAKKGQTTAPPVAPPAKPNPAPAPAPAGTYTVKAGDNLSTIAARYGTTAGELARINGIPNPDLIHAGQVLKVKGGAAPAPAPAAPTYTVQPGDNLSTIAAAHGTTWTELARINGISNPDYIQAGQVLRLR